MRLIILLMAELLEELIGEKLRQRGWRLALAESCTGGLVGHRLTNIAGSSDYYLGSVTAYANEAKMALLNVTGATLERHGAVSAETVVEMARGVRQALGAEMGISVSGIAGPGGGSPEKPVGLVCFGLSTPEGDWPMERHFDGGRLEVKQQAADFALQLGLDYLDGKLAQLD